MDEYICPITKFIFFDPYMASDGFNYEKDAIIKFLKTSLISPMTGKKMDKILIKNIALKLQINKFLEKNPDEIINQYPNNLFESNKGFIFEYLENNNYTKLLDFYEYNLSELYQNDNLNFFTNLDTNILKHILKNSYVNENKEEIKNIIESLNLEKKQKYLTKLGLGKLENIQNVQNIQQDIPSIRIISIFAAGHINFEPNYSKTFKLFYKYGDISRIGIMFCIISCFLPIILHYNLYNEFSGLWQYIILLPIIFVITFSFDIASYFVFIAIIQFKIKFNTQRPHNIVNNQTVNQIIYSNCITIIYDIYRMKNYYVPTCADTILKNIIYCIFNIILFNSNYNILIYLIYTCLLMSVLLNYLKKILLIFEYLDY